MRKALIGILLAAAATTPAFAQDSDRQQRWQQRFEQNQARNQARSEQRSERQEPRQEVRQERQESRQAVRAERQQQRQTRHDATQDGGSSMHARILQQQQQREAQQQAEAQARAEAQAQGGNWQGRRGDRQNGYPDGWNNVDPNDRRAVRARDRYLAQERENRREAREDRERREWRDERRADRRWDRYRWRNDRRYDWYSYRNNYRDLYRVGRYYDPYGYGYNRFSIGIRIGRPFYSSRYHISDPWRYRLPDAGPGYAWVRYYNDVLLIDTWSGEVVDVIYDFFW